MARPNLKTAVINEISQRTERDKQRRVGPSAIGGCARCLGEQMSALLPNSHIVEGLNDFSLYPWLGTAVHSYLEQTTFPNFQHELKLEIGEIPGYGMIKGTTDMLAVWDDGGATVVDWKIVGLKKAKSYRLNGVSNQYRYQAMLYGLGCELAGYSVDSIAIVFIPRDSGNPQDIWVYEEAYQPEMAHKAMTRAETIWGIVQEDGWESLPSDDDCYNCSGRW